MPINGKEEKVQSVVTDEANIPEANDPEVENVVVLESKASTAKPNANEEVPVTPIDQIKMEIGEEEAEISGNAHQEAKPTVAAVDEGLETKSQPEVLVSGEDEGLQGTTQPEVPPLEKEKKLNDDFQPEVSAPAKDEGLENLAKIDPKPIAESAMPDVNNLKEEEIETLDEGLGVNAQLEKKPIPEPEEVEIINATPKRPIPAIPVPTTPVPTTPVTTTPVTTTPVPATPVPATSEIAAAHAVLEKEELKVKDAIENYSLPPLPSRDRIASQEVAKTPSVLTPGSPAAIQSPISPPLPKREFKKYPVPPPLHEEMQSEEFRQNMAVANGPPQPPPRINKAKRVESAADMSLIVNRFRQTSHHYQRQDEQSREDLERGKNILKSSYSTFLESLPATASPKRLLRDETDLAGVTEELGDLHDDERALINVDWAYWTQVVNDFPSVASDPEKLERAITGGIPPQIRGIIWQLIANSKSKEFEDIYLTLLDTESPHEASIRRDLKRTKFIPDDKVESLYKVMNVYSVYDPDVGYTQGMAFIATPLIMNCETEADSFGLLIRLMKSYGLRELFLPDMPGLMLLLYQFDRLFEENSPQLYNHLTRQGVRSSMYATQWFLTFFAYRFPLVFVLRIYDIVFVEGIESVLRIAVNLMLKNSKQLLQLKFDKLLDFLKNELFAYYLKDSVKRRISKVNSHDDGSDAGSVLKKDISSNKHTEGELPEITDEDYDIDAFVQDAMHDVHVTPLSLKRYSAEYEEIHELEQQKEAQYESIRIKNNQLQLEVRKLERDYTLLNREHVEIANELIKNRLKIETLIDENKDQKSTILTLKKELEEERRKQELPNPDAAIPSDLKEDLDRTIRRNAEVMDANIKLQDKINDQERIIELLKAGNKAGAQSFRASKPPIANAFTKLFKNDNN